MSTELVYAAASLEERKGYARALASAGELLPRSLYAPVKLDDGRVEQRPSPGKVLLVAETGNMLGIHPIAALNGVNVIEGKPTINPALMRALVQRAGHKLRIRESGTLEGGDYAVTAELIRADDPQHPFTSTWTPHRAARAGLCKYAYDQQTKTWKVTARSSGGKALPWEAYTESLCIARSSGDAIRAGAADVLMGVQYTPEELGGTVNEAGELVDVTATATVAPRPSTAPQPTSESELLEHAEDAEVVDETTGEIQEDRPAWGDRWEPAPWEDAIADALTAEPGDRVARLRHVYRDGSQRGVLQQRMSNGRTLADTLTSLATRAEQDSSEQPDARVEAAQ